MSTLRVGRVGLDVVAMGLPEKWNMAGDEVSLSGVLEAGTLDNVTALRQQLLGYVDNVEEEVVPVTWDDDPSVDGFYRIHSASVSTVPASLTARWFDFEVVMSRVAGYAAPVTESILSGALRTNGHGIAAGTARPWHALPAAATGYSLAVTPQTRAGADGDMYFFVGSPMAYSVTPRFSIPASSWYSGAAKIRAKSGSTSGVDDVAGQNAKIASMPQVVGRQVRNLPSDCALDNGLLRLGILPATSKLSMLFYASSWKSTQSSGVNRVQTLDIEVTTSAGTVTFGDAATCPWRTLTVLRNSPEEATIRLTAESLPTVAAKVSGTLDITLRRGSRYVSCYLALTQQATQVDLQPAYNPGWSAVTGGYRDSANDPLGNRFVVMSTQAFTVVTAKTPNALRRATVTNMDFGWGIEVGGSAATGDDTAQNLVYQYHAGQNETMAVSAR